MYKKYFIPQKNYGEIVKKNDFLLAFHNFSQFCMTVLLFL